MTKKSFFPHNTIILFLLFIGGWLVIYIINNYYFQGIISELIGGVAVAAFLGGLLGLGLKSLNFFNKIERDKPNKPIIASSRVQYGNVGFFIRVNKYVMNFNKPQKIIWSIVVILIGLLLIKGDSLLEIVIPLLLIGLVVSYIWKNK